MSGNHLDVLAALEEFVVDNGDLSDLESELGRFNIFDALAIEHHEIRHSNFLAFILDPSESHGHGQVFLKAFLVDLLRETPAKLRPISPVELDGIDLRGVEILREWKDIDILITSAEPSFVVAIENKVGSHDHSRQLDRYSAIVRKNCDGVAPLFAYLTPDGDDPVEETKEKWVPYSYAQIHCVFRRVQRAYRTVIGTDVLSFLDHYLRLIETKFMENEKLDELCRRIYKNHRLALDVIWERVRSPEILSGIADHLEHDGGWHVFYRGSKSIEFLPTDWLNWLPRLGLPENEQRWICARLKWRKDKIVFSVQLSLMADVDRRKAIAKALRGRIDDVGLTASKANDLDKRRVRVSAGTTFVDFPDDGGVDSAETLTAAKKGLDQLRARLERLAPILKAVCAEVAA